MKQNKETNKKLYKIKKENQGNKEIDEQTRYISKQVMKRANQQRTKKSKQTNV